MSNPILLLITRPHDPHYQSYCLDHRYYPAEAALFENKRRSIWYHIFSRNKNIPCPQTIKNLKSNLYLYLRSWNCLKGIQSMLYNKCIWRNIPLVSSSPSPLIPRYFILHALYFLQRSFSKIHLFLDFFSLICGSSFFFFPIKQCPSPPASFSVNLLSLWLSRWHNGKRIHLP